jgi:hypothetical protein
MDALVVNRSFSTKSGPRYLKARTVCLPLEFVDNAVQTDHCSIDIAGGPGQGIHLSVTGATLKKFSELKIKEDRKFYVFHY